MKAKAGLHYEHEFVKLAKTHNQTAGRGPCCKKWNEWNRKWIGDELQEAYVGRVLRVVLDSVFLALQASI